MKANPQAWRIYRIGDLPDWGSTGLGDLPDWDLPDWGAPIRGGRGVGCETPIGSAIVAMAAAIVTIANVVMAAVVEPQQSWS